MLTRGQGDTRTWGHEEMGHEDIWTQGHGETRTWGHEGNNQGRHGDIRMDMGT